MPTSPLAVSAPPNVAAPVLLIVKSAVPAVTAPASPTAGSVVPLDDRIMAKVSPSTAFVNSHRLAFEP